MSNKREPSQYFDRSLECEVDAKLPNSSSHDRISRELQHGRLLAQCGAGEIWNWESPAGKLRWARRVKMLSSHLKPGMTVLELGCGAGYFTQQLARSGADIVAIDVSPELLEIAKANCSAPNVRYRNSECLCLELSMTLFLIPLWAVRFCIIWKSKTALRDIYRVLKAGGYHLFHRAKHAQSSDRSTKEHSLD